MLRLSDVTVEYGEKKILGNINFTIEKNKWLMIVGPNGAGKSTLLKAISKDIPYKGTISIDGNNILNIKQHILAKKMGILMQNHYVNYSFTVEDVVSLGRYAYTQGLFQEMSDEDNVKIENALECTGILPLRNQSILTLSGGELQRTFLAQLLAQDPKMLLLDEPSNHLDLIYQKQIFGLVKDWLETPGRTVVSVVHDLSIAKSYGTNAILLDQGHIVSFDTIDKTLSIENLNKVYKIDVYGWMNEMLSQWQKEPKC